MKYIDIHAHLDFPDFNKDRDILINDMLSKSIGAFNIGTSLETSQNSISLAEKYKNIWAVVGIHPSYVFQSRIEELDLIEKMILHPKCVAIGECGMDLFRAADDKETKDNQVRFFEKQIEQAIKYNKPLMIHCREAYPETLDILESFKKTNPNLHAHFHFFTESIDTARKVLDNNFTLSFTGPITFANYDDLIRFVPIDSIMVETDAPYAAPKSVRGQRSDPRHILEIGEKISQLKKISEEDLFEQIKKNVTRIFGI